MPIPSQPTTNISLGPTLGPTNRSVSVEHGGASPFSINAYHRGQRVADHPVNAGVPTSGSIAMSQFNGSSIVLRYIFSSDTQNINLLNYASSPSRVGTTKSQGYQNDGKYTLGQPGYGIEVVINPGVSIGSATRTQNAFETGANNPTTGWHPDVKIVIKNQGTIAGAGGGGGRGGGFSPPTAPTSGEAGLSGGNAIIAQRAITIQNQGTVGGGGGGGGGGGSYDEPNYDPKVPVVLGVGGGGGGGGAGSSVGTGGQGGGGIPDTGYTAGPAGANGTLQQGGLGGGQVSGQPSTPGDGGSGASLGGGPLVQPGQSGTPDNLYWSRAQTPPTVSPGGAGAAPGFYARGNANITWQENGTRLGQVSPTV